MPLHTGTRSQTVAVINQDDIAFSEENLIKATLKIDSLVHISNEMFMLGIR